MIEVLLAVIGLGIFVREIEAEVQDDRIHRSNNPSSCFPLVDRADEAGR